MQNVMKLGHNRRANLDMPEAEKPPVTPAYIVYLVMMFVFVFGSYILYLHGKNVAGQKGREKSIWVALLPVSYSIFAALLGTQSVLFSKSVSVLLRATFSGDSQLDNWYTWVTLLCFILAAGFWVTRLNKVAPATASRSTAASQPPAQPPASRQPAASQPQPAAATARRSTALRASALIAALRLFPAMIIVPLMQICWTLFSIISGMIYFQEYMSFNPATARNGPLNAIMFSVGVLVVFIGVFLLTKSGHSNPAEEHKEEDTVKAGEGAGIELAANPAYEEDGHGASGAMELGGSLDLPPKNKVGLDTLRFTSELAQGPGSGPGPLAKALDLVLDHWPGSRTSGPGPVALDQGTAMLEQGLCVSAGVEAKLQLSRIVKDRQQGYRTRLGVALDLVYMLPAAGLATNTVSFNKTMTKHTAKRSMGATSPGPRTSTDSPGFSPVHQGPDSMNGSMRPDGGHRTRGSLMTIDSEGEEQETQQMGSPQAEGSMSVPEMGTLKKGAKKIHRRLKADFNVDPEDFKQIFGLGKGNAYMPAMSMFTMPGVDLVSSSRSQQAQKRGERGESTERVKESLFSALPQSRFFDSQAARACAARLMHRRSMLKLDPARPAVCCPMPSPSSSPSSCSPAALHISTAPDTQHQPPPLCAALWQQEPGAAASKGVVAAAAAAAAPHDSASPPRSHLHPTSSLGAVLEDAQVRDQASRLPPSLLRPPSPAPAPGLRPSPSTHTPDRPSPAAPPPRVGSTGSSGLGESPTPRPPSSTSSKGQLYFSTYPIDLPQPATAILQPLPSFAARASPDPRMPSTLVSQTSPASQAGTVVVYPDPGVSPVQDVVRQVAAKHAIRSGVVSPLFSMLDHTDSSRPLAGQPPAAQQTPLPLLPRTLPPPQPDAPPPWDLPAGSQGRLEGQQVYSTAAARAGPQLLPTASYPDPRAWRPASRNLRQSTSEVPRDAQADDLDHLSGKARRSTSTAATATAAVMSGALTDGFLPVRMPAPHLLSGLVPPPTSSVVSYFATQSPSADSGHAMFSDWPHGPAPHAPGQQSLAALPLHQPSLAWSSPLRPRQEQPGLGALGQYPAGQLHNQQQSEASRRYAAPSQPAARLSTRWDSTSSHPSTAPRQFDDRPGTAPAGFVGAAGGKWLGQPTSPLRAAAASSNTWSSGQGMQVEQGGRAVNLGSAYSYAAAAGFSSQSARAVRNQSERPGPGTALRGGVAASLARPAQRQGPNRF
ncbi:hypothetical protein QJQ45_014535 [Haematococcus lacustris]|nr:hypothetical protein QJQ45_014535 [Haematococcus lacustris]